MPLRFAGSCAECGVRIDQKTKAWYDSEASQGKKITCTTCRPVGAQLTVDSAAEPSPTPSVPKRPARTDLEKGTELEQQIAAVFAAAGYQVRTNVVREGKSGTSHEVDVLAEKTDELLTVSVAIECKAWASPIEKDVVTKSDYVRRDLGLGHGIVVSLNGARPGALAAADELGIIVWGPDELEPRLGRVPVLGLQNRPMVEEVGFPRLLDEDGAARLLEKEASGRFGIGREEVVWSGSVWIPVSVVQLTLMKMKLVRRQTRTSSAWAVYDLIAGTFVTGLDAEPDRTPVAVDGGMLRSRMKAVEPAKRLDKVIASYDRVTSDSAKEKYRGQLGALGVPDWHTATTGDSHPFLYPLYLAIAQQKAGTERVVAVDAYRSRVDADLSLGLSKSITWVRDSLGI